MNCPVESTKNRLSDINIREKSSKLSYKISNQQLTDYPFRKTGIIEVPYSLGR
jgi:hypothetical protein